MQSDFDSTLVRRGRDAVSLSDMVAFVEILEERPIARLLEELPEIARLSETKFTLATRTLRKRFRGESPVDQEQLRLLAQEIANDIADPVIAGRIRTMFAADVG